MASTFTWLDFSEGERRQAMEVIDQFRDEDTRDELGIGTVRDSLADQLFPGTSTIQTRARYFLFIPWVYLELERRKIGYAHIAKEARKAETVLIDKLLAAGADLGVIGARSRGKLQRLPSTAYWAGLRKWGILQLARSKDEYHRWLDLYYDQLHRVPAADESDDAGSIGSANWHQHIPSPPEGFPDGTTFDLSVEEADYLADRIRQKTAGSLLAHYISHEIIPEAPLPWLDEACQTLPEQLQTLVDHARHFSEVMHGAALLYNLLLAESHPQFADLCVEYRDRLTEWWAEVPMIRTSPVVNKRDAFWSLVESNTAHRVPPPTKTFVNRWHEMVIEAANESTIVDNTDARFLIEERERKIKHRRARIGNHQMLQDWGGKSGTAQLNYRWPTSSQIIEDIVRPLKD
ncbi:MAG: hypothetical protein KDA91_11130 [Planctomycetaceae bacterium]|nr:hypothetical protein [Planctomycetaceae bacterium]